MQAHDHLRILGDSIAPHAAVTREDGQTTPLWVRGNAIPALQPRNGKIHTSVCVVGAGIAGLTTAYLLAREGVSVTVVDRGQIAAGETGRTTAHLASALDDRFFNLERLHGEDASRLAAESHMAAIDEIERIVQQERIDCGFRRLAGYLFAPPDDTPDDLHQELEAARRAGLECEFVDRAPLPSFDTGLALRFMNQAQFEPLGYCGALAMAIMRMGGAVYTGVNVTDLEKGSPAKIVAGGNAITADFVVMATNTPVIDRFTIHTKQAAYRTYAIAASVARGSIYPALYWDTFEPYHYVRLHEQDGEPLLIVGGEDHKTGQDDDDRDRFQELAAWASPRFGPLTKIRNQWSGQVIEPVDRLAYLGRNPGDEPNVFIATGDSGHGMTHGTIAGMVISDLIMGRSNPWEELYDPSRKKLSSAGTFVSENANVAAQYLDWVKPSEVSSPEHLAYEAGAVIQEDGKKVAVYKDRAGAISRLSAVCPHLGCIVAWNAVEHTWDCPCHGSRFDTEGSVLNGPAVLGLQKIHAREAARG